jgi:hypothetical protein
MGKQKKASEPEGTDRERGAAPQKPSSGGVREEDRQTSEVKEKVEKMGKTTGRKAAEKASQVKKTAKTYGKAKENFGKKLKPTDKKSGSKTFDRAARVGKQAKEVASRARNKIPEMKEKIKHVAEKADRGFKAVGLILGKALKKTTRATGKLARVVNVKAEKTAEKRKMRRLFQKIGEKYYTMKKEGKSSEEANIDSLVEEVERAKEGIHKLEKKERNIRSRPQ